MSLKHLRFVGWHNYRYGTTHLNEFWYQNTNFGLCRILISTLNGAVTTGSVFSPFGFGDLNDRFWDIVSISAYRQYVNDNVFAPAGCWPQRWITPAINAWRTPFCPGNWMELRQPCRCERRRRLAYLDR